MQNDDTLEGEQRPPPAPPILAAPLQHLVGVPAAPETGHLTGQAFLPATILLIS